jgi:hypothetical protein
MICHFRRSFYGPKQALVHVLSASLILSFFASFSASDHDPRLLVHILFRGLTCLLYIIVMIISGDDSVHFFVKAHLK